MGLHTAPNSAIKKLTRKGYAAPANDWTLATGGLVEMTKLSNQEPNKEGLRGSSK